MDVSRWLDGLGLSRFDALFRENEIDWEVLADLTDEDLVSLEIPLGPRKKLLKAIAQLRANASEQDSSDGPTQNTAPVSIAERRQLTVIFVDLVGSTQLSRMLDPEDMSDVILRYQRTVASEIQRLDGHVAKYMGDGVLAYLGWPIAYEDAAERAVRAGLSIVAQVGEISLPDGQMLSARIGIATGQVVVGDLQGAEEANAVVGETPNLASRLQACAAPGTVVISESTRRLVDGLFDLEDLGTTKLKGYAEPQRLFRVERRRDAEGRFAARHGKAGAQLVGRENELRLLMDRFHSARNGEGQVVVLSGEAGIGKSRVVHALREQLRAFDHTVVSHFCSPYHVNSAFHPIIGLLERAAGFGKNDDAATRLEKLEAVLAQGTSDLAGSIPLIAPLLNLPFEDRYAALDLTPQSQKRRTQEALVAQVEGLAARQPVVAIYEDVQWMDPTTRETVELLIDSVQQLPVLVLATCRSDFRIDWSHRAHVLQLSLTRLTRRQVQEIIEQQSGGRALPPELVEELLLRTDGIPLFVEELTKTMLETGALRDAGAGFELTAPLPALAIPSSLQDSLMARLDKLAPIKEVAQAAASIGRRFPHWLIAEVASIPESELSEALGKLQASDIIFRRGAPPDAEYSFKHALVQDAAYQSLLRPRRREFHYRIAAALKRRADDAGSEEPEILARHLTEAGLCGEALEHWRRAGQAALARSATTEAIAHFSKALESLVEIEDDKARHTQELQIHVALASAYVAARGIPAPEVGASYARARELCNQLGDIPKWFAIRYGQCIYHLYRNELEDARLCAADLIEAAERVGDDKDLFFFAHRASGVAAFPRGDFNEARNHLERALEIFDPARHHAPVFVYAFDPEVVCLDYLARTLLPLGEIDAARARHEQAIAAARASRHHNSLALPLFFGAMIHQLLGEEVRVRMLTDELETISCEQGFRLWQAGATVMSGWLTGKSGDVARGASMIREGIRGWEEIGGSCFVSYFLGLLADVHRDAGEHREALEAIDAAIARCEASGEKWLYAEHLRSKAEMMMATDPKAAEGSALLLATAIDAATAQGAHLWRERAEASGAGSMING